MGRLAWYGGVSFSNPTLKLSSTTDDIQVSAALAAGVVVSAFNQRANFYSACVYLAQSNLCLMVGF
jgi:E3 ubiquitin-protein ligase synoviolin